MDPSSLLDRIHLAMVESGRTWPAGELAREFLRLTVDGPAPQALIRRMLAADRRFAEVAPGQWAALRRSSLPLVDGGYVLAWVEIGESPSPEGWRLHLRPYEPRNQGSGGAPDCITVTSGDPDHLERARRTWEGRRLATFQSGPLGRFLQWMERRWGLAEWSSPLVDLQAWVRVALLREGLGPAETQKALQLSSLSERWRLGPMSELPPGVPLPALSAVFDRVLERFGSWTEEAMAREWEEGFAPRPVPWERFAFDPAEVEAVPDSPGIYRFYDDRETLLYVGKAVRLARRVGSYFRPLPPESTKREQLLQKIHRFEVEPLPSELEALVREAEAIRLARPPWNVQVEIHPIERLSPDWWWPLVFVAPGEDPLRVSAFLVAGPEQAFLMHLPREGRAEELCDLAAWLDQRLEDGGDPARRDESSDRNGPQAELVRDGDMADAVDRYTPKALEPPEARLVLRFYLRQRDLLHRVESVHFTNGFALLEGLLALAQSAPQGSPIDQRPSRRGPLDSAVRSS